MSVPKFTKADRISGMALSQIVQLSEAANRRRAAGHDVLSFATGEPDFPTPPHICEAAIIAMKKGDTRYTPTAGTPALRDAIARHAHGDHGPENVIVSTGAKQVIANAFAATLNPGDEVIIPAPYWSTYVDTVQLFEGAPVIVNCDASQGFKISPAQLENAITPRTRWVMLNSPSNPTGAVYSSDELAALETVLLRHPHVWLLSDEIYEHICYVPFASCATAMLGLSDRLLVVNGVSKAHSMTGWRIGWGVGSPALIEAMTTVQGQITSGASSISQAAALAALEMASDHVDTRRATFRARRDIVIDRLNAVDGITCPEPDGAFYVFPSCAALISANTSLSDDADFCRHALETEGLVLVPGRAFGMPGHFRMSFAYGETDLLNGLDRLNDAALAAK
ncbi:pyridoxal phosphate-dependent aminotransferase [uncultured Tateyamaria sp.]|uniref:pyridoxal phosphate-dependent aminotransferase n=1 Tax=uncultured Tateyamaria sp. TaxID=455651 RepID=UPI0026164948|nr:pyridoxal phosphate-dependent aminotransferase [uncultured Tateyamaria sp.]